MRNEPLTDEESLKVLKSLTLSVGRGSGKTEFQGLVLESMFHAIVALEEKVKNKKENNMPKLDDIWEDGDAE